AARSRPPARDLVAALRRPGLQVIAEIKRRSPSAGVIAADLDPAGRARAYATGGAAAISVLTEPDFFGGSIADLRAVRDAVDVPVLRKDFTVSPAQVWEARAAGADAVLLIVAALSASRLGELLATAREAGLAALVEAHTSQEAAVACRAGAELVGVNNRDLATFRTDLGVAEAVASHLPEGAVRVAESGVSTPEGAERMWAAGYDAILVGEALVRADDPAGLLAR
ncbi:MAG: indole-3-glycerol phosphate synthase TrpC, partial [Actinobacteria bacterium]|nr:indole-3-glycerol phosphate synthase TrpC [Actinomycetota bacterium]NIS34608.1 indole-3-glycerol phosphate synthase TrpC [Actinomycetota bacterium]NIT97620.1 indole-3-glycerol phosphate synthase TrpC [Actinomycetota bacterium]NIU69369.1 indole-3-glycerol phosphate synthase TrpC [Actinomycetota bacterium]NIV57798.1 indole-3-glycerol phosphate synthase TrpC [Actinomycetota bacterium]